MVDGKLNIHIEELNQVFEESFSAIDLSTLQNDLNNRIDAILQGGYSITSDDNITTIYRVNKFDALLEDSNDSFELVRP